MREQRDLCKGSLWRLRMLVRKQSPVRAGDARLANARVSSNWFPRGTVSAPRESSNNRLKMGRSSSSIIFPSGEKNCFGPACASRKEIQCSSSSLIGGGSEGLTNRVYCWIVRFRWLRFIQKAFGMLVRSSTRFRGSPAPSRVTTHVVAMTGVRGRTFGRTGCKRLLVIAEIPAPAPTDVLGSLNCKHNGFPGRSRATSYPPVARPSRTSEGKTAPKLLVVSRA